MLREAMQALSDDLACALDPVRFSIRAGIIPDPYQAQLLRSDKKNIIVNCSRQSGKSTITSVLASYTATYIPNSLTLILAPSERQAKELLRKVKAIFAALGQTVEQATDASVLKLEFANGARIEALPGKESTIRGFSGVTLLIVDEASRVPDELYQAIRPMLAVSGGRIVLLSTPFGRRGFFFEEWENGGDRWERLQVTAAECSRIDPDWLAQEHAAIGSWWFEQEYECRFKSTDDQLYSYELITDAMSADVQPLFRADGSLSMLAHG
jgi:superfamily II DNA or RNA helicase